MKNHKLPSPSLEDIDIHHDVRIMFAVANNKLIDTIMAIAKDWGAYNYKGRPNLIVCKEGVSLEVYGPLPYSYNSDFCYKYSLEGRFFVGKWHKTTSEIDDSFLWVSECPSTNVIEALHTKVRCYAGNDDLCDDEDIFDAAYPIVLADDVEEDRYILIDLDDEDDDEE